MPQKDQMGGAPADNQNAASASSKGSVESTPESFHVGDTYNINNSGSGVAIGRVDKLTIGKQQFEMTEEVMNDVLSKIDVHKPVTLYAIGPSYAAAVRLAQYLTAHGVKVAALNAIGQWIVAGIDVPQIPIIIGGPAPSGGRVPGSTPIVIDVTK